jgi:hypothetical protein
MGAPATEILLRVDAAIQARRQLKETIADSREVESYEIRVL